MKELRGTGALVRLIVARDRLRFGAWILGILTLVVATAESTKGIYDTQARLDEVAAVAKDNPVALAFNGPDQALDTIGGQVAFQIGAFGLLTVGLMTLLLVARVTRGEEDSGRLELVRSMPVGRRAPLAAGLAVVGGLSVLLGALVTASLVAEGLALHGSIVFGASYVAFGLAFVGITAVAAQIAENPRVVGGTAGALLAVAFGLRALGDIGDGTLSWLSPIGWAQKARPYAGERWWPLLLLVGLGIGLVWAAAVLAERRDFGAGMVASKLGPARAAPSLDGALGLAVRLNRGAALWWGVAVLALGAVYGSLANDVDEFVSDNDAFEDIVAGYGQASLTDSFLATSLLVTSLLAAGPALQIAARLRSEEAAWRTDAILATPISRLGWLGSHLVTALASGALAVVLGGFGLGAAYALAGGGARQVPRLTGAALAYIPAVWLLTGLAVALFGLRSRWAQAAWVAFAGCFVIGMFGPLLDLPTWLVDLSPFQHTPAVPADALRPLPLGLLTAVAAALTVLGAATFRRRDVVTS